MMDNHVYNLMMQLVQEHKSLWRIKNKYMSDAGDCDDCKTFWKMMEKDKQSHVDELQKLIKSHMG
jgi:formate dehydrogenase maturation protein FdhE